MKHSIATFYINRNLDIIRQFKQLTEKEGVTARTAVASVAGAVGVSKSVAHAVIYSDGYAHRAEAWDLYNMEIEKQNRREAATKTVA